MRYNAFISYNHTASKTFASVFQNAIQKFSKPWYRLRAARLFRDEASLHLTSELWPTIVNALNESEYFLLLASPRAAASHWVNEEVKWWLANRDASRLLIVLTEGRLQWDPSTNDFDWPNTDALPDAIKGAYQSEPFWYDLVEVVNGPEVIDDPRFQDAVATFAAAIHNRPKDELIGEDLKQHRRTRRIAMTAGVALALLSASAVVAATFALRESSRANANADDARRNEATAIAAQGTSDANAAQALANSNLAAAKAVEESNQRRIAETQTALALVERDRANEQTELANEERSNAIRRAKIATYQRLSNHARTVGPLERTLGTLLAIEAVKISMEVGDPDPVAVDALRWNLAEIGGLGSPGHAGPVRGIRWLPDMASFISWSADSIRSTWIDGTSMGSQVIFSREDLEKSISQVAVSPSGQWLIVGLLDGTLHMWELTSESLLGAHYAFTNHTTEIRSLRFSFDEEFLVSISKDQLLIWSNIVTGMTSPRLTTLSGFNDTLTTVAIDHLSKRIATGGSNGELIIWDLDSPEKVAAATGIVSHDSAIRNLWFSPDAQWLLSNEDFSDEVKIWNVSPNSDPVTDLVYDTGLGGPIDSNIGYVSEIFFDPERLGLVTLGQNISSWSWPPPDVSPAPNAFPNAMSVEVAAIDGKFLFLSGDTDRENLITIIDLYDWHLSSASGFAPDPHYRVLEGHDAPISTLDVSDGGEFLASGDDDGFVRIWELRKAGDPSEPLTLWSHGLRGHFLSLTPDGSALIAGDEGFQYWILEDLSEGRIESQDPRSVPRVLAGVTVPRSYITTALAWIDNKRFLAEGRTNGEVALWDAQAIVGSAPITEILGHNAAVTEIATNRDGNMLITADEDEIVRIWTIQRDGNLVPHGSISAHRRSVSAVAIGPNSHYAITVSGEDNTKIWDISDTDNLSLFRELETKFAPTAAFSPNGTYLVADNWIAETRRIIDSSESDGRVEISRIPAKRLEFSPSGRWLAWVKGIQAQKRNDFILIDLHLGVDSIQQFSLAGHTKNVVSVTFSEDEQFMVSFAEDEVPLLWDLQARRFTSPVGLYGHTDSVLSAYFDPDGEWVATGASGGAVRQWALGIHNLIDKACAVIGRNMTQDEWNRFYLEKEYAETCPGVP